MKNSKTFLKKVIKFCNEYAIKITTDKNSGELFG